MNGFDPSAFVQAEQQALPLSPPVAKPETPPATIGGAEPEPESQANRAPSDGWGESVATVATVAGGAYDIADLDAGLPFAAELNRMFRYPCPKGFKPSKWYRFREAIRRFVDEGKCGEALACGWEPIELFGYPARPWLYLRAPLFMTGVICALGPGGAGEVQAGSIEIRQRQPPNQRCYKDHHMTGRAASLLIWEALDPARWPVEELS